MQLFLRKISGVGKLIVFKGGISKKGGRVFQLKKTPNLSLGSFREI
jgi:hypothetical protein